jgi:hypothetical protein
MSLGLVPVIITIILGEFLLQNLAIYIGTATGLFYSYTRWFRKGARIPNFILLISTIVLGILALTTFVTSNYSPPDKLPLTIEVSILIPMLILYLHKKRFINIFLKKQDSCGRRLFAQGIEASVVSAKVILSLGFIHFAIITIMLLSQDILPNADQGYILFRIIPLALFTLCIIINQIGILYFNSVIAYADFFPIVNEKGEVTGKILAVDAINHHNDYIHPVVRIVVSHKKMLYLSRRSQNRLVDKGKIDIPFECYLRYGETLQDTVNRIIGGYFPDTETISPVFNIKYRFENEKRNRLIYLFIIDVENESSLSQFCSKSEGKLWTFQQIEENLSMHLFSNCFEKEYGHLREVICTREKYKAS